MSLVRYGVGALGYRICGFASLTAGLALVCAAVPAEAAVKTPNKVKPAAAHAQTEPFGKIPKGPLQIIISTDQQKLHLYSDGTEVTQTPVATGVPDHPTPLGAFSVIQKSLLHHSNIYSGAPMPFMQRITWSGVAIHEGVNLGHPASHGCVRMSHDFASRLWVLTRLGARVIIARPELRPTDFADPHLFVRIEKPVVPDGATADQAGQPGDTPSTAAAPTLKKDAPAVASSSPPGKITLAADQQPNPPAGAATPVVASAEPTMPVPVPPKPIDVGHTSKAPISIFISRKTKRVYVRQDFLPLFDAPVTIAQPDQPIGTHVFTALDYLPNHSAFRWNVISLQGDRTSLRQSSGKTDKPGKIGRGDERNTQVQTDLPPPQSPKDALARIEIPPDAVAQISQLMVPGSSLIISDEGLGEETGEGTDFVVVTPIVRPQHPEYAAAAAGQPAPRINRDAPPPRRPMYRQVYRPDYVPVYPPPNSYYPAPYYYIPSD